MTIKETYVAGYQFINKIFFAAIKRNSKTTLQFILAVLFIAIGFWFFKHQGAELSEVKKVLQQAKLPWIFAGITVTLIYVILQGYAYKLSLAMVKQKVPLWLNIILFLKRNFVSVFLPAGGVTSLAFFSGEIEKRGISKSSINFASSIYAFLGILSVVCIALPIFFYSLSGGITGYSEIVALLLLVGMLVAVYFGYKSISKKGVIHKLLIRIVPSVEVILEDIVKQEVDRKRFLDAFFVSMLIDAVGILHLYIAMVALGFTPTIESAMLTYLVSVVFLIISPFMRGLGAIEVSMTFILTRFGYSGLEAVSITMLYRFFEFWLPLLLGSASFLIKVNKLLMRIIPVLLLLLLAVVNILSVMTPAINSRVERLQDFIPLDIINASNYLVLLAGFMMLITSIFLLRGLKNAWRIAFLLALLSAVGHLTKAIDYEEAAVAILVMIMLLLSRKEYVVKTNPKLQRVGLITSLSACLAVVAYGVIGFYFLDKHRFNCDFSLIQSIKYTLQYFFMVGSDLTPTDPFSRHFLGSIRVSGMFSLSFLLYTIIRPYFNMQADEDNMEEAKLLVEKHGQSCNDYFKTYYDKLLFFSSSNDSFISYKVAINFAVVLETPVAPSTEAAIQCIKEFDKFCFTNGLKAIYYRVPESSLHLYTSLKKRHLFIGQEAAVDLETFTLEGRKRGTLRNAVNKVADKGYKSTLHTPKIKDGMLQKLKAVSDEWLHDMERSELVFSQGKFDWEELKNQPILTVENEEEKIAAFLNIIPDYAAGDLTYDLIRKTADAPNGVTMFLLIELFKYAKEHGYKTVSLGFAPLSGIDIPKNMTERSMKYAYTRMQAFSHHRGLREFKERFYPRWENRYIIYENDFDLLTIPSAISKVIKP